jgi:hypothetical protein
MVLLTSLFLRVGDYIVAGKAARKCHAGQCYQGRLGAYIQKSHAHKVPMNGMPSETLHLLVAGIISVPSHHATQKQQVKTVKR